MLQPVDTGRRRVGSYRGTAPPEILDELERRAADLIGARVLHVSATPYGGGVSELLRSMVPVLNDLGLVADWKVISGDKLFFEATKAIHNGLQGATRVLTQAERDAYAAAGQRNATLLDEEYDFVFVHDPQPAPIPALRGKGDAHWIWRCHIDTSEPNADTWEFVRDYLGAYDAAIFTMPEFLPPGLPIDRVEIVPPAIDPLSPKNLELPEAVARQILGWIGVRLDRPLVTQISRFDPWKDPLGVIEAYRLAREEVADLELVLAGSMALDDPQGWDIYRAIESETRADPRIHVFTNLTGVGNVEVNAFQRLSDVVIQKSLREGFGLVVSEAMWKGTAVVAGRAGGIPLQMADGVGGMLVDSIDECAAALVELLTDRHRSQALGSAGRERVRDHFLLPRLIVNELTLMLELADRRPRGPAFEVENRVGRDPVCGMAVDERSAFDTQFEGRPLLFCSQRCRARFLADPIPHLGR